MSSKELSSNLNYYILMPFVIFQNAENRRNCRKKKRKEKLVEGTKSYSQTILKYNNFCIFVQDIIAWNIIPIHLALLI